MQKIVFVFFSLCIAYVQSAIANSRHPGDTYPLEVEINVGGNSNISCTMNLAVFPGRTVDDLQFINMTAHNETPIPKDDIIKINSTTVIYMLRNATEQQSKFLCKCQGDAIDYTNVYVGAPPRLVEDFSCSSYDFEYMLCNFTKPNNPILTQYNLSFHLESQNYQFYPICNYGRSLVTCNVTIAQKSRRRSEYHFKLQAVNNLGTRIQRFNVNNSYVMVPATPGDDMRVIFIGTNSFEFAWRMPNWDFRIKDLYWEIQIIPDNFPIQKIDNEQKYINRVRLYNEWHLNYYDLPFAYYWYELRLRVKVRTSNRWSEPFYYRFRTAARLPDRPPRTSPGSFYIDSAETYIRIYWEQLELYEHNGANLTYVISEMYKNNVQINPDKEVIMSTNSAQFVWDKTAHYLFTIRSHNHVGLSQDASSIEIPANGGKDLKDYVPRAIHNVEHVANRTYTLSWKQPMKLIGLQNYTVFWCLSKRALQNECKGSIHFHIVGNDISNFTTIPQSTHEEHTLNLAVSANYIDFNAGMHWTSCTLDVNSDLIKMEPNVQMINAKTIRVDWSQIVCPSILRGYNLTYCEIENEMMPNNCFDGKQEYVIVDRNDIKYELTNLKPFTLYKINIFMYSMHKVGKISDSITIRTDQSAPSPPHSLKLLKINNTTATLYWLAPLTPNGIIRNYIVFLNNQQVQVITIEQGTYAEPQIIYELKNLTSFTLYEVFVVAETVEVSNSSNPLRFTTLISFPSKPEILSPTIEKNNEVVIQWAKPAIAGGRLEFYEVDVKQMRQNEIIARYVSQIIGGLSCVLKIPICIDDDYRTVVDVRAVNVASIKTEVVDLFDDEMKYINNDNYNNNDNNNHDDNDDDDDDVKNYDDYSVKSYEFNSELICAPLTRQNEKALKDYQNVHEYRLYKSAWQGGPIYGCSPDRLSRITKIAFFVIVLTICIISVSLIARKKYNKMSNIDCKLPSGLAAYITKDGCGIANDFMLGSDKMIDDVRQKLQRSVSQNEIHCLLTPNSDNNSRLNDTSYLNDAHMLCSSMETAMTDYSNSCNSSNRSSCFGNSELNDNETMIMNKQKCVNYIDKNFDNYISVNSLQQQQQEQKIRQQQQLQQTQKNSQQSDYINPAELMQQTKFIKETNVPTTLTTTTTTTTKTKTTTPTPTPTPINGYITVNNIEALTKPKSLSTAAATTTTKTTNLKLNINSGYVQPSDLETLMITNVNANNENNNVQKQQQQQQQQPLNMNVNSSGYTTLESLCQKLPLAVNMQTTTTTAQPITTPTINNKNNNNNNSDNAGYKNMRKNIPAIKQNAINVPNNTQAEIQNNSNISGYVTQKDLTTYGQQQHII